MAVCGCFKPGQVNIEKQLEVARAWVEAGFEMYWYYPADTLHEKPLLRVLEELERILPEAPLRLTVIRIKPGYATIKDRSKLRDAGFYWQCEDMLRRVWERFCYKHYPPEKLWLPSHQVARGYQNGRPL